MRNPTVPIAWGELVDKITILKIKLLKLVDEQSIKNVQREYGILNAIFFEQKELKTMLSGLQNELQKINEELWEIEDKIRDKERSQVFDQEFIKLARSVYFTNDKRADIKRKINMLCSSELIEEKSYSQY